MKFALEATDAQGSNKQAFSQVQMFTLKTANLSFVLRKPKWRRNNENWSKEANLVEYGICGPIEKLGYYLN